MKEVNNFHNTFSREIIFKVTRCGADLMKMGCSDWKQYDFSASGLLETFWIWQLKLAAATAAKSRQSCPTLCDPIDGSPPGSHPWDSPGKNTGVGCYFLLQCMKVKSQSEVAQSFPTQRTHGLQPTRLLRPWDFPGKSAGVGRHCLLRIQSLTCQFLKIRSIDILKIRSVLSFHHCWSKTCLHHSRN